MTCSVCGRPLPVGVIVGLIVFMLFGSTDPGEPVDSAVALLVLGLGMAAMPLGRALVRVRRA